MPAAPNLPLARGEYLAHDHLRTWSGSIPARSSAALMTVAPNSWAAMLDSAPQTIR